MNRLAEYLSPEIPENGLGASASCDDHPWAVESNTDASKASSVPRMSIRYERDPLKRDWGNIIHMIASDTGELIKDDSEINPVYFVRMLGRRVRQENHRRMLKASVSVLALGFLVLAAVWAIAASFDLVHIMTRN